MRVNLWESVSGRSPVLKFIEKQPDTHAARIMKEIDYFEKRGLDLLTNPNKLKRLQGYKDLYELKIDFMGVFYRIILIIISDEAWLLEAFKKQNNGTRTKYISTALHRSKQFI